MFVLIWHKVMGRTASLIWPREGVRFPLKSSLNDLAIVFLMHKIARQKICLVSEPDTLTLWFVHFLVGCFVISCWVTMTRQYPKFSIKQPLLHSSWWFEGRATAEVLNLMTPVFQHGCLVCLFWQLDSLPSWPCHNQCCHSSSCVLVGVSTNRWDGQLLSFSCQVSCDSSWFVSAAHTILLKHHPQFLRVCLATERTFRGEQTDQLNTSSTKNKKAIQVKHHQEGRVNLSVKSERTRRQKKISVQSEQLTEEHSKQEAK